MARIDIEFKTSDQVVLRGWLYRPDASSTHSDQKLPCLIMCHGWSALKEMDLDIFADHFVSHLPVACLVFDNRGFGASDTGPNMPRHEIVPSLQISDIQDAITYAQNRDDVDKTRIGIWGTSYSGAHVLNVASIDKRVKAVISQVPLVDGPETFNRIVRPDFQVGIYAVFEQDRVSRLSGKEPMVLPVVDADPLKHSALPSPDSYKFFSMWEKKSHWKNEVTVKSLEYLVGYSPTHQIHNIAPTPLLMVVGEKDVVTPTDLALKAYARALEPKQLHILKDGGHFDGYSGNWFDSNARIQVEFLKNQL